MKYFEDLQEAGTGQRLTDFLLVVINDYKTSDMYKDAYMAYEYFCKKNVTIRAYKKLLYELSGEVVPDNYSANYKLTNAFFPIFIRQENSFLLGNGVTFNKAGTKKKFGDDDFDTVLYNAGECALWGGVSYLLFNHNEVKCFKATEFAPLFGKEDGALHAGVRFWQIADGQPLRATLYEEDGYTEYVWLDGEGKIILPKTSYKQKIAKTEIGTVEIFDGGNYPSFPIVPLWGNKEHQSEITGVREKIDAYDLIQSGFANDLDDVSQIYWIVQNAGGMDEEDLVKFLDQMRRVKASIMEQDTAHAEAHTIDIPHEARREFLQEIRDSLFRDAMALDTDKLSAGNITATAINAAYENLELKCDGFEYCVTTAIKQLLELVGIDDAPTYHRRKTTNQPEITQMILSAAQYLDDETILKHLPFLSIDEIETVMKNKLKEEVARYGVESREESGRREAEADVSAEEDADTDSEGA